MAENGGDLSDWLEDVMMNVTENNVDQAPDFTSLLTNTDWMEDIMMNVSLLFLVRC